MCYNRHQDPFEDYKKRLARKLAHQSGESTASAPSEAEKRRTDIASSGNWFGENIRDASRPSGGSSGATGVGKYLNLKRPREVATVASGVVTADEPSKKRKVGWGDFSNW